jgi:small subunit ribosomal protein S20
MPLIKSAKKRVKVTNKKTAANIRTKRSLRDALKAFAAAIKSGDKSVVSTAKIAAESALDTAAKKNVIHRNKRARRNACRCR